MADETIATNDVVQLPVYPVTKDNDDMLLYGINVDMEHLARNIGGLQLMIKQIAGSVANFPAWGKDISDYFDYSYLQGPTAQMPNLSPIPIYGDVNTWVAPIKILDRATDTTHPSNWVALEDGNVLMAYYDAALAQMRLSSVAEADVWAGTADIAANSWLFYVPVGDRNITLLKMPDKSILLFLWDYGDMSAGSCFTKVYKNVDGLGRSWASLSTIATVPINYQGTGTKYVGIPALLPSGRIAVTFPGAYKWFGAYDVTGLYAAFSDDGGATWTAIFLHGPGAPTEPQSRGLMYFGASGGSQLVLAEEVEGGSSSYFRFLYSLDEGTTWTHLVDGSPVLNATSAVDRSYMHDGHTCVLYGNDGYNYYRRHIYTVPDWQYQVFRRPANQLLPLDGQNPYDEVTTWEAISEILASRVDGGNMFFMSPAGYITWVEEAYPDDGNLWATHATREITAAAQPYPYQIYQNTEDGIIYTANPETNEWDPSGVSDHGQLGGLDDDDHGQYLNEHRHDDTDRHALGTVVPHDSFLGLTDTPEDFTGMAGMAVKVKSTEDGLEFGAVASSATSGHYEPLTDGAGNLVFYGGDIVCGRVL